MELLYFISLAIFLIYILVILVRFGVPTSISESAYLFGKNGSIIFHGVFIAFILPLLMFWLDITDGQPYQFIVFISCASLCFTGITGRFKGDEGAMQTKIHTIATIICGILAQLWMWLSLLNSWMWSLIAFSIAFILGYFVKGVYRPYYKKLDIWYYIRTHKHSYLFWIEIALFTLAYLSVIMFANC